MLVMDAVFRRRARERAFVNVVVAPGHTEAEARKGPRDLCVPAEAVRDSAELLKLPRRTYTPGSTRNPSVGERRHSKEAVAAFKAFFDAKKG